MIGTKLAHYEITAHLGSGGMGDVYQATDTKLGRSVAIKFLPEAFSHDTERVARFQREARVLASLNHPNIAAIHGVDEITGHHFLVMELVPGETLADRIQRGPIPIEEALPIAKQIAEALEEAHEKGIIHRDLKPANIKVTPDGKVKVLDFGLAKAYEREQANTTLSNSPTLLSMAPSNAGVILGTAAYMSPEQASGKTVDKRTDLWAFGVVLLEMLSGRPVFEGETVSHVLAAVLTKEPEWSALPLATPTPIRRLLRRCLEKDPKRRLRDISDARLELEEPGSLEIVQTPAARSAKKTYGLWIIALLLTIATTLAMSFLYSRQRSAQPQLAKLHLIPPEKTSFGAIAVSPDGVRIAFTAEDSSGRSQLWIRRLDSITPQPMAGTEGASYPFWSPDSKFVAFFTQTKLKRIDASGGTEQTICDLIENRGGPRGGSWSRGGIILFVVDPFHPDQFYQVPASGGVPKTVLIHGEHAQLAHHHWPSFLPDGRHFLFFAASNAQREESGIYVASLDSGEAHILTKSESAGIYASLPDSNEYVLFVREGTLVAQRFDSVHLSLTGDVIPIADRVGVDQSTQRGRFSFSNNGVLVTAGGSGDSQLEWLDRTGKRLGILGSPGINVDFRISPDGRTVASQREDGFGGADIWLLDVIRNAANPTRLTFFPTYNLGPIWSADGSRVTFSSIRDDSWQLFKKLASGGDDELVLKTGTDLVTADESPDGAFLMFAELNPKTQTDLWVLPLSTSSQAATPKRLVATDFDENFARFSPDGKWMAYQSSESGKYEIYVRAFQPDGTVGSRKWQLSTNGGIEPRWPRHGKEIFYIGPDNMLMSVEIKTGSTFDVGVPRSLFATRPVGVLRYDVSSDGQRFLVATPVDAAVSAPATVVLNWFGGLEERVPVR